MEPVRETVAEALWITWHREEALGYATSPWGEQVGWRRAMFLALADAAIAAIPRADYDALVKQRDEARAALREAACDLLRISRTRAMCRDYDEDVGREPREFLDEEWDVLEKDALDRATYYRDILTPPAAPPSTADRPEWVRVTVVPNFSVLSLTEGCVYRVKGWRDADPVVENDDGGETVVDVSEWEPAAPPTCPTCGAESPSNRLFKLKQPNGLWPYETCDNDKFHNTPPRGGREATDA